MIADEDPNAPHTEEAAGWKLKRATKLTKKQGEVNPPGNKHMHEIQSSNQKLWPDRWRRRTGETDQDTRFCSQIILISLCLNRAPCWTSRVVTAHLTDDFYILRPHTHTHTHKKKDFTSTAGLIPVIIRLFVNGFVWVLLHLHLCLTHCLISADKNINRRANSGASSAALALHFVLPQPATCSR